MTPLDASFLQLEDGNSHMHVAGVLVLEGEPPTYEEFLDFVSARLHLVPRYRQLALADPLNLGNPRWVDDERFDLRFHVRQTALPRPAGEYELQVLASRVFSQQLNRGKPLWEMWLVEGLEDDRFAILSKTHHALVDGISGMDILSVLFAPDESVVEGAERGWVPEPRPSDLTLLAEAAWERLTAPLGLVGPMVGAALRPDRALGRLAGAVAGVGAMARAALDPAPRTPYNRPAVGGDRRLVWVRSDLRDVKAIKDALGGTVNDAVLTVVARALRRDLARRGCQVEELKVFVPVSVRADSQRGALGNQVAAMVVRLPIACSDPVRCFQQISQTTRELKESGQAVGASALIELAGFAPPTVLDQAMRLASRQRFVNLIVTNVPGPQQPLYVAGRRLLDILPLVPVGKNLSLGIAIVSYNGRIAFGLAGDFHVLPELELLGEDFEAALDELAEAAGVRRAAPADVASAPGVAPPAADGAPPPTSAAAAGDSPPEPAHVDAGVELAAEVAEPGAEDGPGSEIRVEPPWEDFDDLTAPQVIERLGEASDEVISVVALYERAHRDRRSVVEATERTLARR